jgi:hypothetical protein
VEKLSLLIEDKRTRHEIGMQARDKAVDRYSLERLRRDTVPHVMRALTGVV